jgi:PKD repeat protein
MRIYRHGPASLLLAIIVAFGSCTPDDSPEPEAPFAAFSYTSSRIFPVNVQFTNTSTSGLPATSFAWDFGDGQNSAVQNPSHSYAAAGAYSIRLIQQYTDGTRDTAIMVLNLTPTGPSGTSSRTGAASFVFSINGSYAATFTNNSANATSYSWDFGDGTHSTSPHPVKNFAAPGTYHVILTASRTGASDTCSATITF